VRAQILGRNGRLCLAALLVVLVAPGAAAAGTSSADVPLSTKSATQIETSLAIANDDTTIVGAYTDKRSAWGHGNCSYSHSTDAGLNWAEPSYLPGLTQIGGGTYYKGADPAVAYSAKDNSFNYLCLVGDGPTGDRSAVAYEKSTDGGKTWSAPQIVEECDSSCGLDKEYLAVDNVSTSPFYGRIYATWTYASGGKRWIAESHLIGSNWSAVQLIGGGTPLGFGPVVAAGGPNGYAYIGWCTRFMAKGSCKGTTIADLHVSKSIDGGPTWPGRDERSSS
jgi:hypothetical protein